MSVVVPAYNEENGIARVLVHLAEVLSSLATPSEIIVVDDGSCDGTPDAIGSCGVSVTLVRHAANRGYGASLKTGIRHARHDVIVITDADGTYPVERIPEMVALMGEGHDMVVGARVGKDAKIPWLRRPAKWVLRRLANYLTGVSIPDLNSGLRAMRREVVQRFERILPNGFSFTTTITLAMLTNAFSVKYIPIDYHRREGVSKIRPFRDTLGFLQLIIRTVLYFEPLKIFLPSSIVVFGAGLSIFVIGLVFYDAVFDVTFLVLGTCAIQLAAIGMLADLLDKRL